MGQAHRSGARRRPIINAIVAGVTAAFLVGTFAVVAHTSPVTGPNDLLTVPKVEAASDCRTGQPSTLLASDTAVDRSVTGQNNRHAPSTHSGSIAVWANATAYPVETGLDISGSHQVVHGQVVSRSHIKMGGSWNQLQHGTEYSHRSKSDKAAFDLTGSNNCFTPIPARVNRNAPPTPPLGFPFSNSFDPDNDANFVEHFDNVPGPAGMDFAAQAMADPAAGPQYFVCGVPDPDGAGNAAAIAQGCSGGKFDRAVQGSELAKGLYYVTGETILSASNLLATVTIYSGAQLKVNGSNQSRFFPYTQGLLFASNHGTANTENGEDALKVEGSTSTFEGIIVAFRGRTELAGSQNKFTCPVMGDRVRLNGQLLYINSDGCNPNPSLGITKTPDGGANGTINAGQNAEFTITVNNSGSGPATNVDIDDTLTGTGWTITSALKDGQALVAPDQCSLVAPDNNVLHCDIGTLPAGKSVVVKVSRVTTTADCTGDTGAGVILDNGSQQAGVAGDAVADADNNAPVNDPGHIIVKCPSTPTVEKTPDGGVDGTINAGDNAVFTITVVNGGAGAALDVDIDDTLTGSGWTVVSAKKNGVNLVNPDGCTMGGASTNVLHCDVANLPATQSIVVIVSRATTTADCRNDTGAGVILDNGSLTPSTSDDAIVDASNSDPDTDPGHIIVKCGPDLDIDKTPDGTGTGGTIDAGDNAVFTITVKNNGAGAALNLDIDDTLTGTGWSIVSALKGGQALVNPDQCSFTNAATDSNILHCDVANLPVDASVVVVVSRATTETDCAGDTGAGVILDNGSLDTGAVGDAVADADNNDAVTDPGHIIVKCPSELLVTKSPDGGAGAGTINAGQDAVFTIVVENNGSGAALDVDLDDTLSGSGWSVDSAKKHGVTLVSPDACTITGANSNVLHCDVANLPAGQKLIVVVSRDTTTADCAGDTGGGVILDNGSLTQSITDDAIADASNSDPDADPGHIIVKCPPSLDLEKTPDGGAAATINAGDNAVFTITVTNNGTGAALGLDIDDTLTGTGWTITSAKLDGGALPAGDACAFTNAATDSNVLHCDVANLPAGKSVVIVLTRATTTADCAGDTGNGVILDNGSVAEGAAGDAVVTTTNGTGDNDPGHIIVKCPDAKVEKGPDDGTVAAGNEATFTVTVTANGPGTSYNVILTDELPGELTWTVGGTDKADCAITEPVTGEFLLTCDFGDISAAGVRTITLSAPTDAGECGRVIMNTAEISGDGDTNAANNSNDGDITVECGALRILKQSTKTGNPLVNDAGSGALFTVTDLGTVRDNDDPTAGDFADGDATFGEICIPNVVPGTYKVNETTPPTGYGGTDQTDVNAIVVAGTNCTTDQPVDANSATFTNPPLGEFIIDYNDLGSTETSASITCVGPTGDDLTPTPDDATPDDFDDDVETYTDLPGAAAPGIEYTCTITIDP